jgi:hypothetical protein
MFQRGNDLKGYQNDRVTSCTTIATQLVRQNRPPLVDRPQECDSRLAIGWKGACPGKYRSNDAQAKGAANGAVELKTPRTFITLCVAAACGT